MDLKDILNDELFKEKAKNEVKETLKEGKSTIINSQKMAREILALKLELELQRKVIKKLAYNYQRQPSSDWMDMKATQEFLQLAERTIYKYINKGWLGRSKFHGKLYFKRSELLELLEQHYQKNNE